MFFYVKKQEQIDRETNELLNRLEERVNSLWEEEARRLEREYQDSLE